MALDPELADETTGASDELPPAPTQRLTIGKYDILEEIGAGGMGVVYRARNRQLGRTVALKLLRAGALAGPAERHRFLREARAGAGLQHRAIVQVFEVGEYEGCPYLALEYVSGESLARRLASGAFAPWLAAALVEELARAVHFAHDRGVIHRDLKPANILLANDRREPTHEWNEPKIADFGLARLANEVGTDPGTVMGTPAYMAPEQAAGRAAEAGPAADIYALGAILYECLTGGPPFQAATPVETLRRVLSEEPKRPSSQSRDVAPDLETICLTCLAKEPSRRYASAAALADDLRRFLDGRPILARPAGHVERTWRWCRRNPRVAALLGVLAAALVVVAFQWQRSQRLYSWAESQRTTAEANLTRYRQAADDFAGLLDQLDTDQLFHLRWAPLRAELIIPALHRNQEFLDRHESDADRRAEIVQTQFRIAMLTRLLSIDGTKKTRETALAAGQRGLAALEKFTGEQSNVVQYRRDRAALTHNLGYLLHANERSAESLPIMEAACRQRQELLDGQPENLDYRSELAGCWNDRGMVLHELRKFADAIAAHDRAIELQIAAVEAAPQMQRYRQFLGNHYFNRAMALRELGRKEDAIASIKQAQRLLPNDAEQWIREARMMASLSGGPRGSQYMAGALTALRRAWDMDAGRTGDYVGHPDFDSIRNTPEFRAMVGNHTASVPDTKSKLP